MTQQEEDMISQHNFQCYNAAKTILQVAYCELAIKT